MSEGGRCEEMEKIFEDGRREEKDVDVEERGKVSERTAVSDPVQSSLL